jgi:hypothetical protein
MVAQELDIELPPAIRGFVERISLLDKPASGFTHPLALIPGHCHDSIHGFGQGRGVGYTHEQAGFIGNDCLAGPSGVCGDYGQARCGGLKDGYG